MGSPQFTLTIESRLDSVHALAAMARRASESAGLSGDELNEVELCITEAANNAIKHAYLGESKFVVELVVTVLPDSIVFDLFDSGVSAEASIMEADRRHLLDVAPGSDGPEESGRGIAIMQSLMDSLEYIAGPRNRLRLTRRLPRSGKES
jgi:serine/threonine-protein kinase RsbW